MQVPFAPQFRQALGRLKQRLAPAAKRLRSQGDGQRRSRQLTASTETLRHRRRQSISRSFPAAVALAFFVSALGPMGLAHADTPAPIITTPAEGAVISGQPVRATGTSVPNAIIEVFEGTTKIGGALADSSGRWTAYLGICSGTQPIRARAISPDLEMGPFSPPRTFTVDAAPLAPDFTDPAANARLNSASVALRGQSLPCTTVTIRENGIVLAPDLPVTDWVWSVTLSFSEGSHTVTATAKEASGRVSSATPRTFSVDLTAPAAPTITAPAEGAVLPSSTVGVSGTAESSATVRVYEAQTLLATTTASSSGSWNVSVTGLTNGPHSLTARATDAAGNTSIPSAERRFVVDTIPPTVTIATTTGTVFLPGDEGRVTGSASDDRAVARVEVRWQNLATSQSTTTVADCSDCGTSSATWSTRAPAAPGAYRAEATAVDGAGNRSTPREVTIVRL